MSRLARLGLFDDPVTPNIEDMEGSEGEGKTPLLDDKGDGPWY